MAFLLASGAWDDNGTWDDTVPWTDAYTGLVFDKAALAVPAERTVQHLMVPSASSPSLSTASAPTFESPLDPRDRVQLAMDWTDLLRNGEKIAAIERTVLDQTGTDLGVIVDTDAGRTPVIDNAGQLTGLWLRDGGNVEASQFSMMGRTIAITQAVRTNSTPYKVLERTALAVMRQL